MATNNYYYSNHVEQLLLFQSYLVYNGGWCACLMLLQYFVASCWNYRQSSVSFTLVTLGICLVGTVDLWTLVAVWISLHNAHLLPGLLDMWHRPHIDMSRCFWTMSNLSSLRCEVSIPSVGSPSNGDRVCWYRRGSSKASEVLVRGLLGIFGVGDLVLGDPHAASFHWEPNKYRLKEGQGPNLCSCCLVKQAPLLSDILSLWKVGGCWHQLLKCAM